MTHIIKKAVAVFMTAVSCAAVVPTVSFAAGVLPSETSYDEIGAKIEQFYDENKDMSVGMSTAVFTADKSLYNGYFGFSDRENDIAFDEETVVEWGSITKLTVWVSVMQLYEQKKIDLNADIQLYLPNDFLKRRKFDDTISMTNLMNHDSGFVGGLLTYMTTDKTQLATIAELLRDIQPAQAYRPGETVAYSGWTAALAAYIVERVSGMEFSEYVRRNIFEPLGMENTSVYGDHSDNLDVLAKLGGLKYYNAGGGLMNTPKVYDLFYPEGGCVSNLKDLETFAQALLSRNTALMKKETFDEMFKPTKKYSGTDTARNCHGFWCEEYSSRVLGHYGNTSGCSCCLKLDIKNGVGMVVMTNQANESTFNKAMPMLVFGETNSENLLADVAYDGAVIDSSYIVNGPLSALRYYYAYNYSVLKATEGAKHTFAVETDGRIESLNNDMLKADGNKVTVYKVLMAVYAAFTAISVLTLLIKLIKRIMRKKSENPLHGWHSGAAFFQIFSAVPIAFVYFMSQRIWKTMIYKMVCVIFILAAVAMAIMLIYWLTNIFRSKYREAKFIVKFRNFYTALGMAATLASVYFFELYQFWAL